MLSWKKLGLLPGSLLGTAAAAGLTALLCLAVSPLFTRELLPLEHTGAAALLTAGVSVCASVWLLTRRRGRQTLATAGIVAGSFVLLAALVCALGGVGFSFGPWLVRLAAAVAVGALFGAIMSLRTRPAGKGKRRRR